MRRSEMKAKSGRKALRDLTNDKGNGVNPCKSTNSKKKPFPASGKLELEECFKNPNCTVKEEYEEGDALDRLLLVQSDLSSLLHQVDKLVVQALKLKGTSKEARKEIESLSDVLSDTLLSLKPWVPRLQKAISTSTESENESRPAQSETVGTVDEAEDNVDSPEPVNSDLLISPSPLVSWRANCTVGRCKQLFLLTPLPLSKTLSSRHQGPSKLTTEMITSDSISQPPLEIHSFGNTNDDFPEIVVSGPKTGKPSYSSVSMMRNSVENGLQSPEIAKQNHSTIVMTPCFKMSPPKSCTLLEPFSGSLHLAASKFRKSTPYPAGMNNILESDNSESSRSGLSKGLALKYPELLGIQGCSKLVPEKKNLEASPDWFLSPPKTCVLMEPPDEKSSNNQDVTENSVLTEKTPTWEEPQSVIWTGKRHPGENTLKRELWEKFEAASTNGLCFNTNAFGGKIEQKGFLDLLDEVSCDEPKWVSEGLTV